MASSGKKGKTKWKSVPLVEVCGTGLPRKTTNWVDQVDSDLNGDLFDYSHKMEKVVLPTAPRAARAPENEAKVPKEPPFQAYISNLPYEILEDELVDFFHDMKIKSVRLPRDDRGNRARGFGYVEFEDRQSLLSALGLGDTLLKGRRMRIEVAEHSDMNRGMGKGPRDGNKGGDPDRTMGDWRSGPRNEDRGEDRDSYRGGSRRDYGGSGFSRRDGDRGGFRDRDRDRDGFSDRGGGFSDRGGSGFRDRGRDREYNREDYGGGGFRDSGDRGYRDSDRSYYSDRRDRDGDRGGGGGGGVGTWRRETDRDKDRDRGDSLPPPEKNEPKTRTKLNLQPRTKPIEDIVVKEDSADEAPVSGATASSIFGGARPVDTAAREREIEERLAREREEKLEEAARSKTGPPPSKDRDKERDRDRDRDKDKERERDRDQGPPPPREDSQPPPSSRNLEAAPPPKENAWGRRPQPPPQVNNGRVSPREDSDSSSSKHRDTTPPPPPPSHRQSGKEDTREPDSQKKYQPPRRHQQESEQKKNRDDDRRRDDKWKSGGGPGTQRGGSSVGTGGTGAGPTRPSTEGRQITPRTRELRKDSGDDVSRMPKLQEHVAPNFAASNKFAFLDDTDTAPEED